MPENNGSIRMCLVNSLNPCASLPSGLRSFVSVGKIQKNPLWFFRDDLNGDTKMQNDSSTDAFSRRSESSSESAEQDASASSTQKPLDDICAICCEAFILRQFTDANWHEDALAQEAINEGWYEPGRGTRTDAMGKLLERHGIPVNRRDDGNALDLMNELAQGHWVIVGQHSSEPCAPSSPERSGGLRDFEKIVGAALVLGIDTSEPNALHLFINNPITGKAVTSNAIDEFITAWENANFTMIATQGPAPAW